MLRPCGSIMGPLRNAAAARATGAQPSPEGKSQLEPFRDLSQPSELMSSQRCPFGAGAVQAGIRCVASARSHAPDRCRPRQVQTFTCSLQDCIEWYHRPLGWRPTLAAGMHTVAHAVNAHCIVRVVQCHWPSAMRPLVPTQASNQRRQRQKLLDLCVERYPELEQRVLLSLIMQVLAIHSPWGAHF